MEEKKTTQPKEEAKVQKLTYEQLNEACMQLYQQNQEFANRLQQMERAFTSKRLDYLFAILEHEKFFLTDFVIECANEIADTLRMDNPDTTEEQ